MKSLLTIILLLLTCLPLQARLHVSHMTCENLVNPLAVDVMQPRLSWWNVADVGENRQWQTAFQLQVASSPTLLDKGHPDLWDSGKRKSAENSHVVYEGLPLRSGQDCYWRVRVWDRHGRRSAWSPVARWHMGLLQPSDWQAQWIGAKGGATPLFRKDFSVDKPVSKAFIYICGLGCFELYVDGQKVGDDVLVPNQTDYTYRPNLERTRVAIDNEFTGYRCLYLCYDLTSFLPEGRHALGVLLGNGFFNSGNGFAMPYGQPRLIAQLNLVYEDGTEDTIITDPSWLTKSSAITMNGIYSGENYDARLTDKDWCTPLIVNQTGWVKALPVQAPDGKLETQMGPPDKVTEFFPPKTIARQPDGTFLVDFGEVLSGWVHLRHLRGVAGQQLKMEYLSESPNGENNYTMCGDGQEEYHPRFTWFVFRKVKIHGLSQQLTQDDITAEAVNSDLPTTGHFACSDTLLAKIHHIWRRTLLDNAHGSILSDCPHRERAAYLGDGQVACNMVMSTFDARALYTKWFADMRLAQNPRTGFVPFGAPWQPGCGGGVPWSAAMILMPYAFFNHYADQRVLEQNYSAMLRLMDYFQQWVGEDGTMEQHYQAKNDMSYWCNLGEWCTPTPEMPSNALVHTYTYWRCAEAMANIAARLGKTGDAGRFRQLRDSAWQAFHRRFYDEREKSYGPAGSNLFALYMGVPEDRRTDVVEAVRRELDDHQGHLYTGIFGTQIFFETLAKYGLDEEALKAFRKTDFPSFGHWIAQGATTTWEQWDGGNSHCHPMFGGGLTWLYTWLGGLHKISGRKFDIEPHLPADISWVECAQDTNYGTVRVKTERVDRGIRVTLDIPVGCQASVVAGHGAQPITVASGHHVLMF